jgi:hypothetical protein
MAKNNDKHECDGRITCGEYGVAHGVELRGCAEDDDGRLWLGYFEVGQQVGFCPYCGTKAKVMPEIDVSEVYNPPWYLADKPRLVELFTSLGYKVKE